MAEQESGNPGEVGAEAAPADAGSFLSNISGGDTLPGESAIGDAPALDTADGAIEDTTGGPPDGELAKFWNKDTQKYDDEGVRKSYASLEKLLSRDKVPMPTGDDDDEGWERVNAAFRPPTPDAYDFGEPPVMPEGIPYDEDAVENFRNLAFANGIPQRTAKAIYETEVKSRLEQHAQWQKLQGEDALKRDSDLRREYGMQYPAMEKRVGNLMDKYGDPSLRESLNSTGQGNDANLIRFLDKISRDMGGETKLVGNTQQPQAQDLDAAIAKFTSKNETVLFDNSHPDHARMVKERDKLFQARYPEPNS